ncbi:hypothetical protein [Actinomadura madurae]|uniref:hypothetical protein n=1 Tax=Actinomadura madurae TaxID=1993 RepID=UPI0020D241CF|nr:hypothetical protein [Actinomadura madurae]MCP9947215.1 hypothetical protein [Actinomadura madurae]MCP9963980.1 hypothetical protein [Actinomadura madurae]MCP9976455.1 hypothetical protein [Actinomadura madurae]MCQ0012052.1 hypothetical protein [Actinomadura madurae]MCQ0012648.1 hypothetical protein [Actinomadura madurae]
MRDCTARPVDLPPDVVTAWAACDPAGYYAAVDRDARALVEREARHIRSARRGRVLAWLRGRRHA